MQEEAPNNGHTKKSSDDLIADAYAAIGAPREQTGFSVHSDRSDNASSLSTSEISQANDKAISRPESFSEQKRTQQRVPLGVPQGPETSSPTPQKPSQQKTLGKGYGYALFLIIIAVFATGSLITTCATTPSGDSFTSSWEPPSSSSISSSYDRLEDLYDTIETEMYRVGNSAIGYVDVPESFELSTEEEAPEGVTREEYRDSKTGMKVVLAVYAPSEGMTQLSLAEQSLAAHKDIEGYGDGTLNETDLSHNDLVLYQSDSIYISGVKGSFEEYFFTTSDGALRSVSLEIPRGASTTYYKFCNERHGDTSNRTTFNMWELVFSFSYSSEQDI